VLAVVDELNHRPRKTYQWQRPSEVFKIAGVALIA
jgi:IS30 family transposase